MVGLLTRLPRECAEEEILQMLAVVRRGRDTTGIWAEESLGLYIGWIRREGSSPDQAPLRNERGDVVLFFSGEEFPEPGTGQRLKQRGHTIGEPGQNYLVHLHEEDPSFPAGLNGRFHGVLIDRSRSTAFLFNDRYAMHRIYYHQARDTFYFAAEAKAILSVCPETRKMDLQGAGEFVSCNCALEGRTLFDGIYVLPGGAKWSLDRAPVPEKRTYFNPEDWENQQPLEPLDYYRKLRDVFSSNLPRYFKGPEAIGMSLTGGLDTRTIMAWQNCEPGSFPCYTFRGMFRDSQDVLLGRQIAKMCGQSHEVIEVGKEFLSKFAHYAERTIFFTDGCVDVGRAPDLYLNEKAHEIAPVRMSGVYGGEILRRVCAFKPEDTRSELFVPEFRRYIHQTTESYDRLRQGHPVSFAVFRQLPWCLCGVLALEQTEVLVRTPFLDNDLVQTAFRAPKSALASSHICIRLIADGNRALLSIPTDRGVYLNGRPVRGTASHAFLEFLFKAEYAYDMGMPQWLAQFDHALSRFRLERLFLGRHKVFHFRVWYRDMLADYLRDILLDPMGLSRSYIVRRELESIVQGHIEGNRNYTDQIHRVLTLELLHRIFLDKSEKYDTGELRHARLAERARAQAEGGEELIGLM